MSPAATRRYRVSFVDWEPHETVVLATDEQDAIAKAVALYTVNGLAHFTSMAADSIDWEAELLETETSHEHRR